MSFDIETIFIPLITGFASGLVSAILTYYGTRSKIRLDLSAEYDKELRASRLEVYKELWALLEPLARFSREKPISYSVVEETANNMRKWYFEKGGIYLSKLSRKPYMKLKKAMQAIIDDESLAKQTDAPLSGPKIDVMLKRGSNLRTSLADDIGTRRGSFI